MFTYINAICDDLDMKYAGGVSADMYDLLEETERKRLILFAEHFFDTIENNKPTSKNFRTPMNSAFEYVPGDVQGRIEIGNKKVSVLTDSKDEGTNLGRMTHRFTRSFDRFAFASCLRYKIKIGLESNFAHLTGKRNKKSSAQ